jgi:DNA-binding HxlR family transcriptional regulator
LPDAQPFPTPKGVCISELSRGWRPRDVRVPYSCGAEIVQAVFIPLASDRAVQMNDAIRVHRLIPFSCPRLNYANHRDRALLREFSLRIIVRLADGPARFGELERTQGAPCAAIIAKHLKRLQRDGVLVRIVVNPTHVVYSLSPLGESMVDAASNMIEWLDSARPAIAAARARHRLNAESP